MDHSKPPQPGDRIEVNAKHWARGRHHGVIVDHRDAKYGFFCIQFDHSGIGIDGRYLFIDQKDFQILDNEPVKRVRTRKVSA